MGYQWKTFEDFKSRLFANGVSDSCAGAATALELEVILECETSIASRRKSKKLSRKASEQPVESSPDSMVPISLRSCIFGPEQLYEAEKPSCYWSRNDSRSSFSIPRLP